MTRNGRRIPDPDARLWQSLEPEPGTVERVVLGALAARRPRRAPHAGWVAAALALVLAVGALALWQQGPGAGGPAPNQPRISIANVGDVVVVRRPGQGARLLRSVPPVEPREARPGRIQIILRKGESP